MAQINLHMWMKVRPPGTKVLVRLPDRKETAGVVESLPYESKNLWVVLVEPFTEPILCEYVQDYDEEAMAARKVFEKEFAEAIDKFARETGGVN